MELGERMARVEQRAEDHQAEIIRLRDSHHELREQLGVNAAQLGVITAEVKRQQANTETIAERAANKVLAAFITAQGDNGVRTMSLKLALAALSLATAALSLKATGVVG